MSKKTGPKRPLTQGEITKMFQEAAANPNSRPEVPSTLEEVSTQGVGSSEATLLEANKKMQGNLSFSDMATALAQGSEEDRRVEREAREAMKKEIEKRPKDYVEKIAKETYADPEYTELKELKKQKQELLQSDPSYKKILKDRQDINKSISKWYEPGISGAPSFLENMVLGIGETLLSETAGMDKENAEKLQELNNKIHDKALPALQATRDRLLKNYDNIDIDYRAFELGEGQDKALSHSRAQYKMALDKLEETIESLDAVINKSGGWQGTIDNLDKELSTLGMYGVLQDVVMTLPITLKASKGEQLNDSEKAYYEALALSESVMASENMEHTRWYRIMDGTMKTIPFLGQMAATSGLSSGVSAGAKGTAKALVKKGVNKTLAKVAEGTAKGVLEAGGVAMQAVAMPLSYGNMVDRYRGAMEVDFNDDGTVKNVYMRDSLYNKVKRENAILKKADEKRRQEILEMGGELSGETSQELEDIEARLGIKKKEGIMSYSEMLERVIPTSAVTAVKQGLFENINEIAVERFGGKIFDNALGRIPALRNASNKFSTTSVGKVYKGFKKSASKLTNPIGLNSMGGEYIEELLVAPLNSLNDGNLDEIKALGSADTHLDILGQVAVMGVGFRGVGAAMQLPSRYKHPEFYKNRKEVRERLSALRDAINDEEVQRTIDFGSAQSGFSIYDHRIEVQKLRNEGKDKEADKVEQKMFYNLAMKAFQTGTVDEFMGSLDKVAKNNNMSDRTKLNAELAKQDINNLKQVYDRYKHLPNVGELVQLQSNKIIGKKTLSEIDTEKAKISDDVREDIDAMLAREGMEVDYTLDDLYTKEFVDPQEKEKYTKFLKTLEKENIASLENYNILNTVQEEVQRTIQDSMKDFNRRVSPEFQKIDREIKDVSTKVSEILNGLNKEDVNESIIDDTVARVAKTNGKNLSKKDKKAIAESYKVQIEGREERKRQKEEEAIQEKLKGKVKKEQEVPEDPVPDTELTKESLKNVNEIAATIAQQDDIFDNFDELPANVDNFTDDQKRTLGEKVANIYFGLEKETGKSPTFRDTMEHLLTLVPKEMLDEHFNAYKLGWQQNTKFKQPDFDQVYKDLFSPLQDITMDAVDSISKMFEKTLPEEQQEVKENLDEQEKSIQKEAAPITTFTTENVPVKRASGKKIAIADTKMGFNAIRYIEVLDENGNWKREQAQDSSLNLDPNSPIDFRPLLHPDKYGPGTKVQVTVAPESMWNRVKITLGRNEKGEMQTQSFADWVAERDTEGFRESEEFINKVPMFILSENGTPMSYVHDTDWYNPFNVADPLSETDTVDLENITESHMELIQEGKNNVSELRKRIFSGEVSTLEITSKKEGAFYRIDESKPEITLEEANPQSILVVQRNTTLETDYKTPFENENRMLLNNKEKDFGVVNEQGKYQTNGHTWDLRRIGTDLETGKETWRAFPITRRNDNGTNGIKSEAFETLRWLWAAQARLSEKDAVKSMYNQFVKGTAYDMTEEQAKDIVQKVQKISGVNLNNGLEASDFMQAYGLPPETFDKRNIKDKFLTSYGKSLYTSNEDAFRQVSQMRYLSKKMSMVNIVDGQVEDMEMDYQGYLRSVLSTNIKSFNVGTEQDPMYATSLQPVITFNVPNEQAPVQDFKERVSTGVEVQETPETDSSSLDEEIQGYEDLIRGIGFTGLDNIGDFDELPAEMDTIERLQNIFNISPGLTILQESQIVDYLFHNLLVSIDLKYGAKVNKRILLNELKGSYDAVTGPTKKQIEGTLPKLKDLYEKNPAEQQRLGKLIKQYEKALEIYSNINDNWQSIEEKALEKVAKYTGLTETRDEEAIEEEDMSLREKDYNKSSIEENGKQKTSYRLRRFMAGIQNYSPNGKVKRGFLGLPTYIGFNDVYNSVAQYFGTGVDIQSDYGTMIAKLKEMKDSSPWVNELVEKLEAADEQIKKEFVYNYAKHALQMKFAMYSTGNNGTTLKIYDTNANEVTRLVRNQWKNNFMVTNLVDQSKETATINKVYAQKLLDTYDSWGNEKHVKNDAIVRDWLSNFGIVLSDQTWEELKADRFYHGGEYVSYKDLFYTNSGIFSQLGNYLRGVVKQENTEFEENEKNNPFTDIQGILATLSKIEAKFVPQAMTLTFRDGGKQISGQVPTKYVTDRINDLKRSALTDKQLLENLKSISISQNSVWLDLLENEPDFAEKLSISHNGITALKQLGRSASGFSSITDLNSLDHDIAKLTGFQDTQQGTVRRKYKDFSMRMANMFLPTMSDKSQMLMVKTGVFNFLEESDFAFKYDEATGDVALSDSLKELLYEQLVQPELKRMVKFNNDVKATNIVGYDLGARMFHFIPQINNVKDADGIRMLRYLSQPNITVEAIESDFKEAMMDVMEETIQGLVQKKMELWENNFVERDNNGNIKSIGLFDKKYLQTGKGSFDKKFKFGTYDFVLNSLIANANSFTLLAGDPAMYAQDKVFNKLKVDAYDLINLLDMYDIPGEVISPYQPNYGNFKKQLDLARDSGRIKDSTYETLLLNIRPLVDSADDSFYINASKTFGTNIGKRLALLIAPGNKLANSLKGEYMQLFAKDAVDISENSEYLIKLFYGEKGVKEAKPLLDLYSVVIEKGNKAKAGEIRSTLMDKFPKLSDYFDIESTDAQEYTTVWEHINILQNQGRLTKEQMNDIKDTLLKEEPLAKEQLDLVLQPIKPVHTGQVYDPKQDVMRTMYIKSSSFPLLPQMTSGTKLESVRQKMEEIEAKHGMPVRLSYQTANKVGAMTNAKDIFSDELETLEDTGLVLSRDNFRIQQDVPFKSDQNKEDKVSMGTQMFKLLFGDGTKNLKEFQFNGEEKTGEELYDIYNKNFRDLIAIKKARLFRELGLDENGDASDPVASMEKMQELLKKEAESRGYPIQDIKGLELVEKTDINGNTYKEFKIPLWLSTNGNRYESLLNAIVSNRIMKHKMPGNSFVAGSETGFAQLDTIDSEQKSRIIWLDKWNGKELQGAKVVDGKMQPAQVLLPSKFKDSDGNLVDLYQKKNGSYVYLKEREDGTFGLKEGMIDPQLLMNFSFRTPTSSHVSGSNIEIVGILPPEAGDLMVVPKNFTKQKGLDYDIDKETAYQLNHVVNPDGTIEVLSEKHREERLKGLLDALEKENLIKGSPEDNLMRAMLGDSYDEAVEDKLMSIQQKVDLVNEKFNEKLLENDFIKMHMAVFSNPDAEMQKKINKVLSMEFASKQADMIEALSDNQEDTSFTLLSDEYQKNKMNLGASGKLAIGIYSNYVTFHGLSQQVSEPLQLQENVEGDYVPKSIVIGKLVSGGTLGNEMTLDGERSIAEAFAERQNTATDNEKEQILGRVNVNGHTINVDSLLTALGFDKDENGNSVSYTLLSQPIMKAYVNAMENGRGIVSDYTKNLQETVVDNLVDQYSEGTLTYSEGTLWRRDNLEEVDYSELLTGDALLDGIKNNGNDNKVQLGALAKFLELEAYARNVAKIQSALNTDNLGKSMVESSVKLKRLVELPSNMLVSNAMSLIGTATGKKETLKKGEHRVGPYNMAATTPQGAIVLEGLVIGNKLWNQYFPYNDGFFEDVVEETITVANIDTETTFKEIEARQDIIKEIKKYIYSRKGNGIFTESAQEERKRLFMDSDNNTSLARYLNNLTNRGKSFEGFFKGIGAVRSNRLLNKFSYEINMDGTPSLVKFNNTSNDNFDEEYLYNSFAELIIEDSPLPEINGKPYSTKELAQDLITYAYVEGGIQEAIQFIKYVPVEYLESVGMRTKKGFVSAAEMMQTYNAARRGDVFKQLLGHKENLENSTHVFTKQFIQHFPEKARQYTKEEQRKLFSPKEGKGNKMTSFILNSQERPKFISKRVPTRSKRKQDKYHLFEHQGNGLYKRISILGTHGMSEYQYNDDNARSLMDEVNTVPEKVPSVKKGGQQFTNPFSINDDTKPTDLLKQIANTSFDNYPNLSKVAEMLSPLAKDTTKVRVRRDFNAAGRFSRSQDAVYLHVDNTLSKGPEATARTFIHEIVHSVTSNELRNYYEKDGNTLRTDIPIPNYVTSLHMVFNEFKKQIGPEATAALKQKLQDRKNGLPTASEFTENELGLVYGSVNIFEFVTTALTESTFQKEMSKVPYKKSGKSIVEKFREAIIRMLRTLNPDIVQDSLAESALMEALNFIEEEASLRKKNNTFETFRKTDGPVSFDDPDTTSGEGPSVDLLPEATIAELPDCI